MNSEAPTYYKPSTLVLDCYCVSKMLRLIVVQLTILTLVVASDKIKWTGGNNFDWPSPSTRNHYKNTGRFIGENVVATRAAIYKDTVFLALPRYLIV